MKAWLDWLVRIALMSKGDLLKKRPRPSPIDREEASRTILHLVRMGFAKFTDMEARIRDEQDAPLTADDERWVQSEIRRQLKLKRAEEASWPQETSWDRLNEAFKNLRRSGIIALHNAGFEETDGITLVAEEQEKSPARPYRGFCFYHEQDIESALLYHCLFLSFGAFEASPDAMQAVPDLILRKLDEAGIEAQWSGDFAERIQLPGFIWQKRSPRASRARKGA